MEEMKVCIKKLKKEVKDKEAMINKLK